MCCRDVLAYGSFAADSEGVNKKNNWSDCVPTSQKNYHWELLFFSNIHQRTTFSAKVWQHWLTLFPKREDLIWIGSFHSTETESFVDVFFFSFFATISEVWTAASAIRNLLTWAAYWVSSVAAFSQQPRTGVVFPSADMFVMSLIHMCQSHVGGWKQLMQITVPQVAPRVSHQ